ncbi:MAG: hypothetical protein WBO00_05730 [Steroidobacteraceae bacterium]
MVLFTGTAAGEGVSELVSGGMAGPDLRYRFENAGQADKPSTAGAAS